MSATHADLADGSTVSVLVYHGRVVLRAEGDSGARHFQRAVTVAFALAEAEAHLRDFAAAVATLRAKAGLPP